MLKLEGGIIVSFPSLLEYEIRWEFQGEVLITTLSFLSFFSFLSKLFAENIFHIINNINPVQENVF